MSKTTTSEAEQVMAFQKAKAAEETAITGWTRKALLARWDEIMQHLPHPATNLFTVERAEWLGRKVVVGEALRTRFQITDADGWRSFRERHGIALDA